MNVNKIIKRRGLDDKVLTEQDIIKHKRLLRECGLPDTIGDSVSQEELEERYPHLKKTKAEKEISMNDKYITPRSFSNMHTIDGKCPLCEGEIMSVEFGSTESDESEEGEMCKNPKCEYEEIYSDRR